MRVVHLSTSDRGGAGIVACRLHQSLLEGGIDSFLLTGYKFTEGIPNHVMFKNEDTINYSFSDVLKDSVKKSLRRLNQLSSTEKKYSDKYLSGRTEGFEYFSFPFSDNHLEKHPLMQTADIIHIHWVSQAFLDYDNFFTSLKKKIVWTLHDMNPFTGGCHHSDGCKKFMIDCTPCPQLHGTVDDKIAGTMLQLKQRLYERRYSEGIRIISPSQWMKNLSEQSILFKNYVHHTIYNGVDENIFKPLNKAECRRGCNLPLDKKIILFVSNEISNPRKGIYALLNALSRMENRDVVLCTIGKKPIESSLSNKTVYHLDFTTDDVEIAKRYCAADVFVLPSLAENFPNTICESLACGTPVVAFNVGGITEQVNDNSGILVEGFDESKLTDGINNVLMYPEKYNALAISKEAHRKFSLSEMSKKYLSVYSELMN